MRAFTWVEEVVEAEFLGITEGTDCSREVRARSEPNSRIARKGARKSLLLATCFVYCIQTAGTRPDKRGRIELAHRGRSVGDVGAGLPQRGEQDVIRVATHEGGAGRWSRTHFTFVLGE